MTVGSQNLAERDKFSSLRSPGKRILVCCDATWNRPDQVHDGQVCASNVTKIAVWFCRLGGVGH